MYVTITTNNRMSVTECSLQLSATCVKVGRAWGIPLDEDGLLRSGSEQVGLIEFSSESSDVLYCGCISKYT